MTSNSNQPSSAALLQDCSFTDGPETLRCESDPQNALHLTDEVNVLLVWLLTVGAWSVRQQGAFCPTEKRLLAQEEKEMEAQITASDLYTLCFSNSGRSLCLQLMSNPCRSGLMHSTQQVVESKILYKVYPCWSEIYS